ncbi:hypothetical protein NEHOM01_0194 [Nematocida homosporus]|uniref:uncharacterized protein n=1 Tax=Nematocida homosporus TaxID=1912981 RepID=UPI00221F399E|nr:uncharacterized protein NEHOM01_0194 [Nematocida homosporus]KAI5184519.1 hypothetical protein NEHOM01_0194 [Nematocida homosporus]
MINVASFIDAMPSAFMYTSIASGAALSVMFVLFVFSLCALEDKSKKTAIKFAVIFGTIALIVFTIAVLCYTEVINYQAIITPVLNWINRTFYSSELPAFEQAKQAGESALEKVKQTGENVLGTVKQTGVDLAGKAKQVLDETIGKTINESLSNIKSPNI